jgi:hypothetical protein
MDYAQAVCAVPHRSSRVEVLLRCGVVAGPLFIAVAFAQALMRSGFDFARHPLSLLTLGGFGWVQILNFVVVGVLFIASAFGMRQVFDSDNGGTWVPRLIGLFGVGLIAGGLFVPDAAFGFPPGSALGAPDELSWHGMAHALAFAFGFGALVVALFVIARRHLRLGERGWGAASVIVGTVVLVLSMWPNMSGDPEGRFAPLWVAMVVGFGWASWVAGSLLKTQSGDGDPMRETNERVRS